MSHTVKMGITFGYGSSNFFCSLHPGLFCPMLPTFWSYSPRSRKLHTESLEWSLCLKKGNPCPCFSSKRFCVIKPQLLRTHVWSGIRSISHLSIIPPLHFVKIPPQYRQDPILMIKSQSTAFARVCAFKPYNYSRSEEFLELEIQVVGQIVQPWERKGTDRQTGRQTDATRCLLLCVPIIEVAKCWIASKVTVLQSSVLCAV